MDYLLYLTVFFGLINCALSTLIYAASRPYDKTNDRLYNGMLILSSIVVFLYAIALDTNLGLVIS